MKNITKVIAMAIMMSLTSVSLIGCGCSNSDNAASIIEDVEETTASPTSRSGESTSNVSVETSNPTEKASFDTEVSESTKSTIKEKSTSEPDDIKAPNKKTVNNKVSSSQNGTDSSNSSNKAENNSATSKNKSNLSQKSSSNTKKTYHEAEYKYVHHDAEYKEEKYIIKPAYTYEEPVYEYEWHTFCNNCGADITDNLVEHMSWEMDQHETGKGYRDEYIQVQTGTKTINVPAEYGTRKVKVKDAWTEKVLVRQAGWY